ncbi:envelope stress response membrane protein PspB [Sphingomonas mesophila]|uniref:envelope stress response membrane protein PspB n=1 Tax=Sphingomonas mesophila TaxID=2303576 RepID=UPI000E58E857|nr:envelope stress response membrane protein PspB [Sphingomonas mesophila]
MEDVVVPAMAFVTLFIGLPWLIFHYVTKWKTAKTLTGDDEKLLDDLYEAARRLDDRLCTIERIMTAENPDWNRNSCLPGREASGGQRLLDQIDALEEPLGRSRRKVK